MESSARAWMWAHQDWPAVWSAGVTGRPWGWASVASRAARTVVRISEYMVLFRVSLMITRAAPRIASDHAGYRGAVLEASERILSKLSTIRPEPGDTPLTASVPPRLKPEKDLRPCAELLGAVW